MATSNGHNRKRPPRGNGKTHIATSGSFTPSESRLLWRETPRCGARRKSDGKPCMGLPMANGRCFMHGGPTPRGDQWHKRQFPADPVRFDRKMRNIERDRKRLVAKLASMTPEERARYEQWLRDHQPGSGERRAGIRLMRDQNRAMAASLADERPVSAEAAALAAEIAALEQELGIRDQKLATTATNDLGILG